MRLPEGNDNVSCGTSAVGGDAKGHGVGMSFQQQQDASSTSATLGKAATRLLEGGVGDASMLGVGDENGVLLPGPEGGVEVREFHGGVLLVRRSEDAKKRSPERLNLHRRRLTSCPIIQGDNRLRLLNYQNNLISKITNLANLPNLIFIDLYNNVINTLEGPLSTMTALRVMMVGKNKIQKISNLCSLRKLDVLDLHSNSIQTMGGLDGLQDLRVLNLAGNEIKSFLPRSVWRRRYYFPNVMIEGNIDRSNQLDQCLPFRVVKNVSCLTALTELNLRRNNVEKPLTPQTSRSLMELSLFGNPVAVQNGLGSSYRSYILQHLPKLHHLDLKRVTDHGQSISHQYSDGNMAPSTTRTASADDARESRGGGNNGRSRTAFHETMGNSGKGSRKPSGAWRTGGNGFSTSGTNSNEGSNDGFPVLLTHGSADTQSRGEHHSGSSSSSSQQQHRHQHQHSQGGDDPRGLHRAGPVMSAPAPDKGAIGSDGMVRGGAWEQVTVFVQTMGAGECGITAGDSSRGAARKQVVLAVGTGMSRAAEAREAVTLKRAKTDREEWEKTALKERREAIEAARRAECWERRGGGSITSRARHRNPRDSTTAGKDSTSRKTSAHVKPPPASSSSCSAPTGPGPADNSNTGGGAVPPRPEPPPPNPRSPTPPSRRTSSLANTGSEVAGVTRTVGGVGGRRSRDTGRRGSISGGVGYFELEQRLRHKSMGVGDVAASGGGVPSGAGGITLKVYGDVWRWLGDGKVCSLREQVVEARFSLVHVTSVARKASTIAQTFPNLSCLQLLDNDIRSLRQLEHLRPMLTNLTALYLGKNPVTRSASEAALRAWVKGQGPCVSLVSPGHGPASDGRNVCTGDRRLHTQQQQQSPLTNAFAGQQHSSPPSTPTTQAAPPLPAAPTPHPPCGTGTNNVKPLGGGDMGVPSRHSNGHENGCEKTTIRVLEQGEAGNTVIAARQDKKMQCNGDNMPGFEDIVEQSTRSASERQSGPTVRSEHTAVNESNNTPASAALVRIDCTDRDPLASTDAAFERLAEARSRAASSSWGAIALAGSSTASHVSDDPDGVNDMAWASSARGAKLACNGMVSDE
ncbi:unnamed protein product [Ectocarpus sp. CCAP 1310/34]|nr:unnamed protein product [Ectocarpus sp. CCAP 1310/34]